MRRLLSPPRPTVTRRAFHTVRSPADTKRYAVGRPVRLRPNAPFTTNSGAADCCASTITRPRFVIHRPNAKRKRADGGGNTIFRHRLLSGRILGETTVTVGLPPRYRVVITFTRPAFWLSTKMHLPARYGRQHPTRMN